MNEKLITEHFEETLMDLIQEEVRVIGFDKRKEFLEQLRQLVGEIKFFGD